jgi:hypothetical protein
MEEVLNIANLLNALMIVIGWSIKQELCNIKNCIAEAKESINKAHSRIDDILMSKK